MGYTNSGLASYTRLTRHRKRNRGHAIDTITIHCYVGQVTAKQGVDYFYSTSRAASAQYVVGYDGSIGMSVEEKDRAYTSSNTANDDRAVTIEVASEKTHPYAVTGKAYEALIALCADICRRNQIKQLLWRGDKTLIGQVDKQNMTVHRWFKDKECPGDYLYSRLGEIACRVNQVLGESHTVHRGEEDREEVIWRFLRGKGLNDFAAAGVMGNLYAESALKPTNLQQGYEKKLGYSDETYTEAVDNGAYPNFARDSAGYGLAQWTYWTRKQALYQFAKRSGKSIGDLGMQLEFLWDELQGYRTAMQVLSHAKTVREASDAILLQYEKPADQSAAVQRKRAAYGEGYYRKYAGKAEGSVPYKVKVKVGNLNIRTGAGTDQKKTGRTTGKGIFTIVEEKQGKINGKGDLGPWGRLKSGEGWICLAFGSYTERV